jgi:regulator of nonsense transcripts 3
MSTENTATKSKGSLKEKEPRERLSQSSVTAERLKTVVRRLPPNLPEDVFWQSVQTWVKEDTVSWKVYYPGKFRKRYVGPTIQCGLLSMSLEQTE